MSFIDFFASKECLERVYDLLMLLASEQLMGYGFANLLLNIGDMVISALSFSTLDDRLWRC